MDLVQVCRHPGQKTVENDVEKHPAEAHAPDGPIEEEAAEPAAGRWRGFRILPTMRLRDETGLGFVDRGMLARIIPDVPPGKRAAQNRSYSSDREGHPPGIELCDEPGDDERAQRRAERSSAVQQGCAAGALVARHPDRVELAAGRIDRGFRYAQAKTGCEEPKRICRERRQRLEESRAERRRRDDEARLVAIGQKAARYLHSGIGEEE